MPTIFEFPNRLIIGAFRRVFRKGLFVRGSHVACFHKAEAGEIDCFRSRVFQAQNANPLLRLYLSDERFDIRFLRLYLGERTANDRSIVELYADFLPPSSAR